MSDLKISDDERAYMDECRRAVEIALIVRDRYASYLIKKYGIARGMIKPDGSIEEVAAPQPIKVESEDNHAGKEISEP